MTPLMQQYWEIKSQHSEEIVLFRMGDFYEMFHRDAEIAAPILNIALTVRNRKSADDTKMCGVPYHSVAGPISKLLAAGFKVAICEQIEDPATAKGLVKRAVTRVLTPGLVYDPSTLEQKEGNYLAAYDERAVSFLEPTTGEAFYYRTTDEKTRHRLLNLVRPRELILTSAQRRDDGPPFEGCHLSVRERVATSDEDLNLPESAERLINYASSLQGQDLRRTLAQFSERSLNDQMMLTDQVLRQLEIFKTYAGESKGSLIQAIDRTETSAGARRLKQWLRFPLCQQTQIESRLDQIDFWLANLEALKTVRSGLKSVGDIERRLGKISTPNCSARDLLALSQSILAAAVLAPVCAPGQLPESVVEQASTLAKRIELAVIEDPPLSVRQGRFIRTGYHSGLDELIQLTDETQILLEELEAREKAKTGIGSLKVRFNQVFGYYIEVTKTHLAKVPEHFQRKQTLANAERFITQELAELETKILSAHARRSDLEYAIFQELRAECLALGPELVLLAQALAELDVLTSLAWLAMEQKYVRPIFHASRSIELQMSRHPVVEQLVSTPFIANSINLSGGECLLLTGPNMAGKSTLMRQVAVAVLLAQMGSFVPAQSVRLPIYSQIFTRIGASDFLSEGLSTFMVEMKEAAAILLAANENSLVILDEIGRGTSTYDGLSLAQAILEHLVLKTRPTVLFATHYHELTGLAGRWPQIRNAHMSIREKNGEITFLHSLVEGPANKSYGIHVAKLAGMPSAITQRARQLLAQFEERLGLSGAEQLSLTAKLSEPAQTEVHPLFAELRELSLQKMTPLEALNRIAQWQQSLS